MTAILYAALAGSGVSTSDLYTVDPSTGVMTSVGPIGYGISGLAFDPTSGILYGSTNFGTNSNGQLITIDTSTGAGTLIGAFPNWGPYHDIAFDASGQLWGISVSGGSLGSIDKATAIDTQISFRSGHYGGGLDFDGATLWQVGGNNGSGHGETVTIDTSTGVGTHVADMGAGNFEHSGKFDAFGVFWVSGKGETGGAATDLYTVDQNTGVITHQATFSVPGVGGLAWGPAGAAVLTANFSGTPLSGPAPLSVNFTDLSTPGPSGPITNWFWDFGDGNTSTVPSPMHVYTTPGHYTVSLQVTGTAPDGTDTKTRTNYIHAIGPDFNPNLTPSTINVSDGISTAVTLNTPTTGGDTESITLSATAPAGFTVTFPDNPIIAGDSVPIDIAVGSPANGTYGITIHCVGTDNSHDVVLTVHVLSIVPGTHIAS